MFNFIKRYWPTALAVLILLTALTGVYAKYVMDQALTGKATITAELGSITLLEHVYEPQADGSYKKTEATTSSGNTYSVVIPGLDIPKDPYVQITDKTSIDVYVYLIITEDSITANKMTYQLRDHWKAVSGHTNVFVYSDENGAIKVTGDGTTDIAIPILVGDKITVSQKVNKAADNLKLSFSACMKQYVDGQTAKGIYEST